MVPRWRSSGDMRARVRACWQSRPQEGRGDEKTCLEPVYINTAVAPFLCSAALVPWPLQDSRRSAERRETQLRRSLSPSAGPRPVLGALRHIAWLHASCHRDQLVCGPSPSQAHRLSCHVQHAHGQASPLDVAIASPLHSVRTPSRIRKTTMGQQHGRRALTYGGPPDCPTRGTSGVGTRNRGGIHLEPPSAWHSRHRPYQDAHHTSHLPSVCTHFWPRDRQCARPG